MALARERPLDSVAYDSIVFHHQHPHWTSIHSDRVGVVSGHVHLERKTLDWRAREEFAAPFQRLAGNPAMRLGG
jgi:hypothetical protein